VPELPLTLNLSPRGEGIAAVALSSPL